MPTLILNHQPSSGNADLLTAALEYADCGLSIIPVIGKKSVGRWKQFQKRVANEAELREAFANPRVTGLAVILGAVSGYLAVRDFDRVEAYESWAAAHPDLAARLPTVRTGRGFHVYFRVSEEIFQDLGDGSGELRADSKHYVVLPPSHHPDRMVYRWITPLPDGALPLLDPRQVGLCNRVDRANRADTADTADTAHPPLLPLLAPSSPSSLLQEEIEKAIAASLPLMKGQRNQRIFRLARELKAIESLNNANASDLRPYVKEWHKRALSVIGTKPFEDTWADFVLAWKNVRIPADQDAIETARSRALASAPPQQVVELYDENEIILLAKICRELQLIAGDRDFFLDCRNAGRLIGVDHTTAWRYLAVLVADGILRPGEKGNAKTRKASRFRFIDPS